MNFELLSNQKFCTNENSLLNENNKRSINSTLENNFNKKLKNKELLEIVDEISQLQQQVEKLKKKLQEVIILPNYSLNNYSRKVFKIEISTDNSFPKIKTFIFYAFRIRNLELGIDLINKYKFDVINERNSNGYTLLHISARHAFLEGVEWCLKNGALLNATTNLYCTPLHFAYLRNDKEIRKLLKERLVNRDAMNVFGLKPKDYKNKRKALVRPIPETARSIEIQIEGYSKTFFIAIWFAARTGWLEVLRLYVEQLGCDVDVKNTNGQTPLMCACEYRHEETVKYLLQMGADPNARDIHDSTPLHYAYMESTTESNNIAELLLKAGADSTIRNIFDRRPQWYKNKNMDIQNYWNTINNFIS